MHVGDRNVRRHDEIVVGEFVIAGRIARRYATLGSTKKRWRRGSHCGTATGAMV